MPNSRSAPLRVLVVEDEALVGEMLQAMLEQLGYTVVSRATTGRDAIERVRASRPDVVLMDIGLPDMDGITAAEQIAEREPTPVVILSAYDTPALVDRATKAGVGAYLVKPADSREIERGIAVARARFGDLMDLRKLNAALEAEVAERRRVERALRESEHRFRMAVDFSNDWETWLSPEGTYIYVSPAVERITGYGREDLTANPGLLMEITAPEDRKALAAHQEQEGPGGPNTIVFRVQTRGGEERWIEHVCRPVYGEDGAYLGLRASNRDITDRMRLQERLREARKMEAIAQLAGGLAHDLNNLLTVVNGYAELAMEVLEPASSAYDDVQEIRQAGERAGAIINQLLAFSRQQMLQVKVLDLNALLAELREHLSTALGTDIRLELALEADAAFVAADAERVRQIVLELAGNAVDAMPAGGLLRVSTRNVEVDEEPDGNPLTHATVPPGPYVLLEVQDTGVGLEGDAVARLFEPYFTTKGFAEADGLGLPAAYGLMRQMGGDIRVHSEPQAGTTFELLFPLARAEADGDSGPGAADVP